jgi:ATP-binding cassette subfamily B protein
MLAGALFDPVRRRSGCASAGEAVTRFRDDVEDVVWFVDVHLDIAGGIRVRVLALSVMSEIDPLVTLVAILPLIAVLIGNRVLTTACGVCVAPTGKRWRRQRPTSASSSRPRCW